MGGAGWKKKNGNKLRIKNFCWKFKEKFRKVGGLREIENSEKK